jgi:two-component system, cell cycle response regulator DivK
MQAQHTPFLLYIEDDQNSREIMQVLLNDLMGFKDYACFESTENFMSRFEGLPTVPDLIFLDIQIEPHNGYEVLAMLRALPHRDAITVIATTASVSLQEVQHLKEAGFNGLIGKPIKARSFPQLVNRFLEGEEVWFIP